MDKYTEFENLDEIYDDRQERHFLMQLVKQDILSDDYGDYVVWEQKKVLLSKPKAITPKIGYNY